MWSLLLRRHACIPNIKSSESLDCFSHILIALSIKRSASVHETFHCLCLSLLVSLKILSFSFSEVRSGKGVSALLMAIIIIFIIIIVIIIILICMKIWYLD